MAEPDHWLPQLGARRPGGSSGSVEQPVESGAISERSAGLFLMFEHGLYMVLGGMLAVASILALITAIVSLWTSVSSGLGGESLLVGVDRLLFVLMLAEILHTVRVSINSGTLSAEPFLIVGLIASIRRVLVITLESSYVGGSKDQHSAPPFEASMIELGVLAALIMVMVISIYLLRRTGRNVTS